MISCVCQCGILDPNQVFNAIRQTQGNILYRALVIKAVSGALSIM